MGVIEDVREKYPTLAFLLNDSEVGPLLRQAVDVATGEWSIERFQAALMQTNWWRRRSQSNREADILFNTDRGTYEANTKSYRVAVRQRAAQLGVGLTDNEVAFLATNMYRNGQDMEGPLLDQGLLSIRNKPGRQREGAVRTNAVAAKQMAKGMYYLKMHEASAKSWGEQLATGKKTQEDLRAYLSQQAIAKRPWLKNSLSAGQTMEDLFSEHKAAISEILEFDPNQLNLQDGKWGKVLDYFDHNTKQRRMMTVGEAEYLARQDPRFWKTKQGRDADAQAATMMLNIFGKRTI